MLEHRTTNSINEATEHHPHGGRAKGRVFYLAEPVTLMMVQVLQKGKKKKGQSGEKDLLGWLVPKDPGAAHVACLLIGVGCN